jgi:hypothetical protein
MGRYASAPKIPVATAPGISAAVAQLENDASPQTRETITKSRL